MIRGRNRIIEKVKDICYIICYNSCYMLQFMLYVTVAKAKNHRRVRCLLSILFLLGS